MPGGQGERENKKHTDKADVLLWRKRWDSNPRTVARQLISSQSRYDHFDTTPYMFKSSPKVANLWEQPLGTAKNNDIKFSEKSRKIRVCSGWDFL